MQFAKDSFYAALRERLSAVNPARTLVVDGASRPGIVVEENETDPAALGCDAFRLAWGAAKSVMSGTRLMKMDCEIAYGTEGVDGTAGDRGRCLGAMDGELMSICAPPRVQKSDYTKVPPTSLGTMIFWTEPSFDAPTDKGGMLSRTASVTLYFFCEVEQ